MTSTETVRVQTCAACSQEFAAPRHGPLPRYCQEPACRKAWDRARRVSPTYFPRSKVSFRVCIHCSLMFCQRRAARPRVYCYALECRRSEHRARFQRFRIRYEETHGVAYTMPSTLRSRHQVKRRGQMAAGDSISRTALMERDGWVCGICSGPIDPQLTYPNPGYGSMDHIVPLSLDGEHVWSNVRAAHLDCNVRRGNRVERELVGG